MIDTIIPYGPPKIDSILRKILLPSDFKMVHNMTVQYNNRGLFRFEYFQNFNCNIIIIYVANRRLFPLAFALAGR